MDRQTEELKSAPGRRQRVAVYARTSTGKQASVPKQVELARRMCDVGGHTVRYVIREEGVPAKSIDRPQLQHLFRLCRDGRVDAVCVWKLDRLVRSLRDLLNTYSFFRKCHVDLMSVTEQFDTASSFGRFNFRNIASAAELERDLIGERSRLGKMLQASRGRWPTQRPPAGYTLTADRDLVVDATESQVVKGMFDWYVGGLPITEITRRLAEAGHCTKRGVSYSTGAVHSILHNPIYAGRWEVLDYAKQRDDLRLISDETLAAVRARRGRSRRDDGAGQRRRIAIASVFDDYIEGLRRADLATPSSESADQDFLPRECTGLRRHEIQE